MGTRLHALFSLESISPCCYLYKVYECVRVCECVYVRVVCTLVCMCLVYSSMQGRRHDF